ncbi:MAG: hypothetical protein WBA43_17200 [Elainellaceae cyanobacterium]
MSVHFLTRLSQGLIKGAIAFQQNLQWPDGELSRATSALIHQSTGPLLIAVIFVLVLRD